MLHYVYLMMIITAIALMIIVSFEKDIKEDKKDK